MNGHLDEFTALRCATDGLAADERIEIDDHLAACPTCAATLQAMRLLHAHLTQVVTEDPSVLAVPSSDALPADDPFHQRPSPPPPPRAAWRDNNADDQVLVQAAEDASLVRDHITAAAAAANNTLQDTLTGLAQDALDVRFGLLYALQEAGPRIAENPGRALGLAMAVLDWARRGAGRRNASGSVVERAVPLLAIRGQAHELAAQALLWTKDLDQAGTHLALAYRCIGRSTGDEISLAVIEQIEAQRRSFAGDGSGAILLARRSRATCEALGVEDHVGRALVTEGLGLFALGRHEEAVAAYRRALPIFERYELWSNYVGALNSIGTSLHKLGRLDEARREYARALRRFSRDEHRCWLGLLNHGLADVFFAAARYRDAAVALARAGQAFAAVGMYANALIALLAEGESWARYGNRGRALQRLELFDAEVARRGALDPAVLRELNDALAGASPDFERLASLREQVAGVLQQRLGAPIA